MYTVTFEKTKYLTNALEPVTDEWGILDGGKYDAYTFFLSNKNL